MLLSPSKWAPAAVLAALVLRPSEASHAVRLDLPGREELASSSRCPAAALALLVQDPYLYISHEPVADPRSPRPVLIAAAVDTNRARRVIAGKNPACPEALRLGALATHPDPMVRFGAARCATSGATLAMFASDDDASVRCGAAENRRCPPAVLTQLAADTNPVVRFETATNPMTPHRALLPLTVDADSDVSRIARDRLRR